MSHFMFGEFFCTNEVKENRISFDGDISFLINSDIEEEDVFTMIDEHSVEQRNRNIFFPYIFKTTLQC